MTTQVLVVDDVPAMAEQYAYDLKRVGKYDAIVAVGGAEALDILAREPTSTSTSAGLLTVVRGC